MVKAHNITKSYGNLTVLKGIDLHIEKSEVVSLVGASGAGKSTLLHILGTLDQPDEGEILIDQQNIRGLKDKKLSHFRNEHIGFVFQFHHLLPEFSAKENICLPGFIAKKDRNDVEKEAEKLMRFMGILDRANHKPNAMSGGEQQRVAIARALINQPKILMADEPSGNLDSATSSEVHKLFFKLRDELGQTILLVTHNQQLANMADRKLEMKDGKIA